MTKQLSCKLQFLLPLRGVQKILFNTLTLVVRQFIVDVLIGKLVDNSVKFLGIGRIREQTELNFLLFRLLQLAEQVSPNLFFSVFIYDAAP